MADLTITQQNDELTVILQQDSEGATVVAQAPDFTIIPQEESLVIQGQFVGINDAASATASAVAAAASAAYIAALIASFGPPLPPWERSLWRSVD